MKPRLQHTFRFLHRRLLNWRRDMPGGAAAPAPSLPSRLTGCAGVRCTFGAAAAASLPPVSWCAGSAAPCTRALHKSQGFLGRFLAAVRVEVHVKWNGSETLCGWPLVCRAAAHHSGGTTALLLWLASLTAGRHLQMEAHVCLLGTVYT